jgi:demethylmenaquinone methyltransferase/2-methoxy-6-polyprenyl-1,4-benzoquinol methylase
LVFFRTVCDTVRHAMPDPAEVRAMFSRIAPRYDLLNHLLSLGIDRRWRARVRRRLAPGPGTLGVDVCCGTGDLALCLAGAGARVLGIDFAPPMLVRARRKGAGRSASFATGDALRLPVRDACADFSSIAFGIRNVANRELGLREMARVVKPGGRVLVLEFSMPRGRILSRLYRLYFTHLLPVIGAGISGDRGAYRYLPDTVLAWPSPEELREEMRRIGLVDCGYELLSGGIACLSWGHVPEAGAGR